MKTIQIHTDGACLGNPGPGGWAALLRWNAHERELAGGEPDTTNNRMELMAAIMALVKPANMVPMISLPKLNRKFSMPVGAATLKMRLSTDSARRRSMGRR